MGIDSTVTIVTIVAVGAGPDRVSGLLGPDFKVVRHGVAFKFNSHLDACSAVVSALEAHPIRDCLQIGIHSFEDEPGSYRLNLRICNRIARLAFPGQVLVSESTAERLSEVAEPQESGAFPESERSQSAAQFSLTSKGSPNLTFFTLSERLTIFCLETNSSDCSLPVHPYLLCSWPFFSIHAGFGKAYRTADESGVRAFDEIELEEEDKERIRPVVADASRVTARYDAWRDLPNRLFDLALVPSLILVGVVWLFALFYQTNGFIQFGLAVFASAVGFALLLFLSLLAGAESDLAFIAWFVGLVGVLFVLLNIIPQLRTISPRAITFFDVGAVVIFLAVALIALLSWIERLFLRRIEAVKIGRCPEEEIIDTLVLILTAMREVRRDPRSYSGREQLVGFIDYLASVIEKRLDWVTVAINQTEGQWTAEVSREMATAVRLLGRTVLVPSRSDEIDDVVSSTFQKMLVAACDGCWGCFDRTAAGPVGNGRATLVRLVRSAVVGFAPLVGAIALVKSPLEVSSEQSGSLLTATALWAAVTTLGLADPGTRDRLESVSKVVNPFSKFEKGE